MYSILFTIMDVHHWKKNKILYFWKSQFLQIQSKLRTYFALNSDYIFLVAGEDEAFIFRFDPKTLSWTQVGEMAQARTGHAVSVVKAADVEQFCVS